MIPWEERLLGIVIGTIVIGIFVLVIFVLVKRGNAKFDEMFAKIGTMEKERLKTTDYQNYSEAMNCYVVLCAVADMKKKKGKTELSLIYYRHEMQDYMADSLIVEQAVVQEKQLQIGSMVSVVFSVKETVPSAWRLL